MVFNRKTVAMLVAEFLGTYVLASTVLAIAGRISFPFFAAATAGATLAAMVLVIGAVSGAHINPAVTFGLWTLKKVSTPIALAYVAVQMLAGLTALHVNEYLLNQVVENTARVNWDWRVVLAEAIGTFVFTFGIAAAVYRGYEGARLALAIGLSLFVGVLIASFGAAGALNPAVALGINSWSLSYVVGPLVGAVLGMNAYALLFAEVPLKTVPVRRKR